MRSVDLNADIGELPWETSADAGLLQIITSANVACGGHAGDAETMQRVCAEAARHGVAVGAQVSYVDREGFGRRAMDVAADLLEEIVLEQIHHLDAIARAEGAPVAYCKPHGALYNTIARNAEQAVAVARACAAFRSGLPVLGLPESVWLAMAGEHGLRAVGEAFADRAYAADGSLLPRTEQGSVLHDGPQIAARVVSMVAHGVVDAVNGERVTVQVESVCVHGDTPGALTIAAQAKDRLQENGIDIASFA